MNGQMWESATLLAIGIVTAMVAVLLYRRPTTGRIVGSRVPRDNGWSVVLMLDTGLLFAAAALLFVLTA